MEKSEQWQEIYKRGEKKYNYYNILQPHKDMNYVAKIFKKNKVKKVLDLGCGAGRNLLFLASKGINVYGIDYAPEGIELIKENLKKFKLDANLKIGNFFDPLPYSNEFFDAIICLQSLQHGNEKQILKAIKEIERILRKKGLIFITLSGRISNGKIRFCLVKTAKKIASHTYVPTIGDEKGLTHFIYDKKLIKKHFKNFRILKLWKDEKDYYCFIAEKKN